mmetsp:Transcript_17869/g.59850  ORF Transcript_17869/g.59850 Transcript_17869/m.59850 type:complete len:332 (-) Transcript_17869:538-1533(-)
MAAFGTRITDQPRDQVEGSVRDMGEGPSGVSAMVARRGIAPAGRQERETSSARSDSGLRLNSRPRCVQLPDESQGCSRRARALHGGPRPVTGRALERARPQATDHPHSPSQDTSTRLALVPPKPNELDTTAHRPPGARTSSGVGASRGQRRRPAGASMGSSRLAEGGARRCWAESAAKTASTAPAAPRRCPTAPLADETHTASPGPCPGPGPGPGRALGRRCGSHLPRAQWGTSWAPRGLWRRSSPRSPPSTASPRPRPTWRSPLTRPRASASAPGTRRRRWRCARPAGGARSCPTRSALEGPTRASCSCLATGSEGGRLPAGERAPGRGR